MAKAKAKSKRLGLGLSRRLRRHRHLLVHCALRCKTPNKTNRQTDRQAYPPTSFDLRRVLLPHAQIQIQTAPGSGCFRCRLVCIYHATTTTLNTPNTRHPTPIAPLLLLFSEGTDITGTRHKALKHPHPKSQKPNEGTEDEDAGAAREANRY